MTKQKKRRMVTTPRASCPRVFPPLTGLGFLLAILYCTALPVLAHNAAAAEGKHDKPYALIFGTVWGPDNHPLYGVKVRIRRADQKKAHWELYSDHNGEFAQRVPPGPADYVVWADLKSYKSRIAKQLHQEGEIKVHIQSDEREDTGLHLKK